MPSNSGPMRRLIDRLRNRTVRYDLRPYGGTLAAIRRHGEQLRTRDDPALHAASRALISRAKESTSVDGLLVEAFSLAREASRRVLGQYPYEEQLLTGLVLHDGGVAEMQTGEGKTLAAVAPAYLDALTGRGVHLLTFNDYLARRDAAWMGPVYRFLGLEVGCVQQGMSVTARRRGYAADITYVTAKEAGFDYLRDGLARTPGDQVQRAFHRAIVDEADSLLIDEARVPLVLAGSTVSEERSAHRLAALARALEEGRDYVAVDQRRNIELTDRGFDAAAATLGCGELVAEENLQLLAGLHCALHAEALLRRDVDYIVRGGAIELVDEFTGRTVADRHWPDGLQAALEAKEGLRRRPDGRLLGSITLQNFLRLYPVLCGMTGTAESAAEELNELYGLDVVIIPTHRPCVRRDHPDVVFTHQEAKWKALLREIRSVHASRRPILVGTVSVAESERLSDALRAQGIDCRTLNARTDELEASIIAEAGAPGAVTISTNMAGRGTDIRLGGSKEARRDEVVALGGLYVIGTNRHESARIDRQLRGRAGRQGDPGSSRFFVGLEDDLCVRYGIEQLIPAKLYPQRQDEPIGGVAIRREIDRAQRIVEGQNFDIRRALERYSSQIEDQRARIRAWRDALLHEGEAPGLLAREEPALHARLCAKVGPAVVERAERRVVLAHLDRLWGEHLAQVGDLRDCIHLVRVGGRDPLTEFAERAAEAYRDLRCRIDEAALSTLRSVELTDRGIDLELEELRGPSATWTYVVHDDPFRDQIGLQLSGPGQFGVAAAAALPTSAGLLLIGWALCRRYARKRSSCRPSPRRPV